MVNGFMKEFNENSLYYQELVKELHNLDPDQYPLDKAKETITTFLPYMNEMGWTFSPKEAVLKLKKIIDKGYDTPEKWDEKMAERERLLGISE